MKRSKKLVWIGLLLLSVTLLAAGCGQKQSAQNQTKTYTVACEAAFAPFEMRDSKGNYTGFDMDLIRALANVEGFKVNIKDMGFDGIIAAVQTGNVDMSISGITITPERAKSVDFSTPYYKSGLVIAVKSDNNTIKNFKDLDGKRIVDQIGTTGAKYCREKIKASKLTDFDHVSDALMEIKNGGADALVNDKPVTEYYLKQSPGDFKIVGDMLSSEYYGIAVPKTKPELLKQVNDGLKKLKANGTYAKIYKKWFGVEPPAFLPGEEK